MSWNNSHCLGAPICWLLTVMVMSNVAVSRAQTERPAVPTAARQREIAKVLDETFDLPKVTGAPKQQQALKKILKAADDSNFSSDEKYVAWMTVVKLAQAQGDFASWWTAVKSLGTAFTGEAPVDRLPYFLAYLEAAKVSAHFKGTAGEEIVSLAQQLANLENYADADRVLSAAEQGAMRVNAASAVRQALSKARQQLLDEQTEWKGVQAAITKLKTQPKDPAANQIVGRWYAVRKRDWKQGLPHLALSDLPLWSGAAKAELGNPDDPVAEVGVGDRWWEIAQKEMGANKESLLLHVAEWYDRAAPNITSSVQKQLVAKRLAEIQPLRAVKTASVSTTPSPKPSDIKGKGDSKGKSDTNVPGKWIDVLELAGQYDWRGRGVDWNAQLAAAPSRQGLAFSPQPRGLHTYPLPITIDGSYELECDLMRVQGVGPVQIVIPVRLRNLHLELSSNGGANDTLDKVADPGTGDKVFNSPSRLINGKRCRLAVRVTVDGDQAEVAVDLDTAKSALKWKGTISSLISKGTESLVRHPWIASDGNALTVNRVRIRTLGRVIRPDMVTPGDRERDLKEGLVRLVNEPRLASRAEQGGVRINQSYNVEAVDLVWPLLTPDASFCDDFYWAHAPSRLTCQIPTGAKSFSTIGYTVGRGSVAFQVSIDGVLVYDSKVDQTPVVKLSLPQNSKTLELITDEAGNSSFDRALWCYPRFHGVTADQITDEMLDNESSSLPLNLTGATKGQLPGDLNAKPVQFRQRQPCDELLLAHAPSSMTYAIPRGMTRFTAIGYEVLMQQVRFEVWVDQKKIYESPAAGIVPIDVKLPPGSKTLELKVDELGDISYDWSFWCYPRLHRE